MFESKSLSLLTKAINELNQGYQQYPEVEENTIDENVEKVLLQTAQKLHNNYPYQHPFYLGQMLKPPHKIARLAYSLALLINPNNHALDGGLASSEMEKEVVVNIATMFGWQQHLGHLTSGGTMANLEALWVAGQIHPDLKIVASSQSHYTHQRISAVLKIDYESIAIDQWGKMDINALEKLLKTGTVGTVVVTLGTTGMGVLDPLDEILKLREKYSFRIHIDSAYGGYFTLASKLNTRCRNIYDCLTAVDSIVIDPHKHGLQPYGCGCVLFQDPGVGKFYAHDSPYTYFSSDELHLGEISLECSRAGAAAVALWATQKLMPMDQGGDFSKGLDNCLVAANHLYQKISDSDYWLGILEPELDIVIWGCNGKSASEISALSQQIFDRCAEKNIHLALIKLPAEFLKPHWETVTFDQPMVTCLRASLMKPEHDQWLDEIWEIIDSVRVSIISNN